MKVTVAIHRQGFNKIEFNKLIRESGNYSLSSAKAVVDELLSGQSVQIEIDNNKLAEFYLAANKFGFKYDNACHNVDVNRS